MKDVDDPLTLGDLVTRGAVHGMDRDPLATALVETRKLRNLGEPRVH